MNELAEKVLKAIELDKQNFNIMSWSNCIFGYAAREMGGKLTVEEYEDGYSLTLALPDGWFKDDNDEIIEKVADALEMPCGVFLPYHWPWKYRERYSNIYNTPEWDSQIIPLLTEALKYFSGVKE